MQEVVGNAGDFDDDEGGGMVSNILLKKTAHNLLSTKKKKKPCDGLVNCHKLFFKFKGGSSTWPAFKNMEAWPEILFKGLHYTKTFTYMLVSVKKFVFNYHFFFPPFLFLKKNKIHCFS